MAVNFNSECYFHVGFLFLCADVTCCANLQTSQHMCPSSWFSFSLLKLFAECSLVLSSDKEEVKTHSGQMRLPVKQ